MGKQCPSCRSERVECIDIASRTSAGVFAGVGALSAGRFAYEATKMAAEASAEAAVAKTSDVAGKAVVAISASASPVAMGTAGVVLAAAATGALTLGLFGQKFGSFVDSNVLKNYRCLACNHKFNGK